MSKPKPVPKPINISPQDYSNVMGTNSGNKRPAGGYGEKK